MPQDKKATRPSRNAPKPAVTGRGPASATGSLKGFLDQLWDEFVPSAQAGSAAAPAPSRAAGTEDAGHAVVDDLVDNADANVPLIRARPQALAALARHGYSPEEISALVVPKRTLARRCAANEPLTVAETDKALRLRRIAMHAERVFGDPAKAYRWLRKPKRALKGATPVQFLASESGARVVEGMLYRIEHGMFA